ncbi:DUF4405 domain-containing protein [Variovorax sp. YR752]|uniref:DUF4405 domain-containing protein n=1 Tax=Variovorax sp. YR752 TaxID=1884383 RepID=UPI00313820BE
MKLQRDWITPITMGAFALLAVTGVLMFFHIDSGLNETAHQWLSWVLIGGVALHAAVNWPGVRRHLAGWRGRAALGLFALLLAASFVPLGGSGEPPFVPPLRALADAPLPVLAQVAKTTPEQMRQRLLGAGLKPASDADTVHGLVGDDTRAQIRVLSQVVAAR